MVSRDLIDGKGAERSSRSAPNPKHWPHVFSKNVTVMNILIIIGAVAVITLLLSIGQGWSSILNSARNNIVFENRNFEYGAYDLRKSYSKRLALAMVIVVLSLTGVTIATSELGSYEIQEKKIRLNLDLEDIIFPPMTTEVILKPLEQERIIQPISDPPTPPSNPSGGELIEVVERPVVAVPILPIAGPVDPNAGKGNGKGIFRVSGGRLKGGGTSALAGGQKPREVQVYAEKGFEYPGGEEALLSDLRTMIQYPELSKDRAKEGLVYVSFVIEVDGSVSEVKAIREVEGAPELSREAERCVKKLKKFKPAEMNGVPVPLRTSIPVHFQLR